MKTFKVTKNITIECNCKKTSYGFKHEAQLLVNGREVEKSKVCYYNRTWESFEYESVIMKLLNKTDLISKRQKTIFLKKERDECKKIIQKHFGLISGIAKLGNVLYDNQKDSNTWKIRMLKAGLGNELSIPEDWNVLDENEKERRLNNVIQGM